LGRWNRNSGILRLSEDNGIFGGMRIFTGWCKEASAKGPKSLKVRQTCGIDPIIEKPRKNSLDRVSPQASEFPVINAERESASEYSKA
jgi:hypothetical protein